MGSSEDDDQQQNSDSLYCPSEGYQKSSPVTTHNRHFSLGTELLRAIDNVLLARKAESTNRPVKQNIPQKQQVGSQKEIPQTNVCPMEDYRSHGNSNECAATCSCYTGCTTLAEDAVVPTALPDDVGTTSSISSQKRSFVPWLVGTPQYSETAFNGLAIELARLEPQRFSSEVIKMKARRSCMKTTYERLWRTYLPLILLHRLQMGGRANDQMLHTGCNPHATPQEIFAHFLRLRGGSKSADAGTFSFNTAMNVVVLGVGDCGTLCATLCHSTG